MILELEAVEPFSLARLVEGHGWHALEPFHWDAEAGVLRHALATPSGAAVIWRSSQPGCPTRLRVEVDTPANVDPQWLVQTLRHTHRLDERIAEFHGICEQHSGLHRALQHRDGRLLRSPTVFEDVVKTLCTLCTTWARTRSMVRGLCSRYGVSAGVDGIRTFPTPEALAVAGVEGLRDMGLGYRARYVHSAAMAAADDALEEWKASTLPTRQLREQVRALAGMGPYATANLLMLLGRYDQIALDSWVRKVVREGWFAGEEVSDREILAAFEPFGEWRALVYWFWDWNRDPQPDAQPLGGGHPTG